MPEFDPERRAPRLLIGVASLLALGAGWRVAASTHAEKSPNTAATISRTQTPTAARTADAPVRLPIQVRSGETFESAVRRTGVDPDQARQVVETIGGAFDTVNIKAGLALDATVLPANRQSSARLITLSMRTGPASTIMLSRAPNGALRLQKQDEKISDQTTVAQGRLQGSLYESAERVGATPTLTAQVVKLFAHKLDFSRDIQPGDNFRLVFDRTVTEAGRTIAVGDLRYAEIGAKGQVTRFYRFQPAGATAPEYFDELGKNTKGFLLRTPVDGAHITSGFGLRIHPILGYTKMHQGIDFGVPVGTPVYAAGDGSVEEAKWFGGYGRWIKLKHQGGWETGYGHLSAWAVRPGQTVHQGQVIAYSGSTGSSTGPHLHYEVIEHGVKINPKGAKAPAATSLEGRQLAAFEAQKSHLDSLLAQAMAHGPRLARLDANVTGAGPRRGETLTR